MELYTMKKQTLFCIELIETETNIKRDIAYLKQRKKQKKHLNTFDKGILGTSPL